MLYIIIGILIFAADMGTKLLAVNNLKALDSIPLIDKILHLTYIENSGIAFGMFGGGKIVFIILTLVISTALLIFVLRTEKRSVWLKLGTAFVISGALGNLVDRIARGYVVDFIDFRIIHFPVFNVADIAVCVGAVMLLIHFLIADKKSEG